ncbi:MAG TPA: hypothetical protein VFG20_01550 [Planctomycetaceae bacterium]|nr:hypothetical protein [Planctomycetaceae bacterium]
MKLFRLALVIAIVVASLSTLSSWNLSAQNPALTVDPLAKSGTRFEMDVIESFDAKYEGDTPGHIGRAGGLNGVRPNIALGDGVFRGEDRIGTITNVAWSRAQGGLTIEFDPDSKTRVAVGDHFWVDLNPAETP